MEDLEKQVKVLRMAPASVEVNRMSDLDALTQRLTRAVNEAQGAVYVRPLPKRDVQAAVEALSQLEQV